MDAFGVLNEVLGDYRSFVEGFLNIQNEQVKGKVDAEIEGFLRWSEPSLALNPNFASELEQALAAPSARSGSE